MKVVLLKQLFYFLFALLHVSSRELFTCKESYCPVFWLGDTWCDEICMTESCNFDSLDTDSLTVNERFTSSDCYLNCYSKGCDTSKLSNGTCDEECNSAECGWDLGDCAFCSEGCTKEMLTNNKCDSKCDNEDCRYDNNDCGWCRDGCFIEDLSDSVCKNECDNYDCLWDNYACIDSFCSEGCYPDWVGNNYCDDACNNLACGYDDEDCSCSNGCNIDVYSEETCRYDSDGNIDDPCAVSSCDFKHGLCGNCAIGCFDEDLGNGICNIPCNNEDCYYDFNDCECNPGCDSVYDSTTGDLSSIDSCPFSCIALSCQYTAGFCDDNYVRTGLINNIQRGDWTIQYNPKTCFSTSCSMWYTLYNMDFYNTKCAAKSGCDTVGCFSCAGLVDISFPNCLRNNDTHCIICDSAMVMDVCAPSLTECPLGYQHINEIAILFSNTLLLCMVEPTIYSPNNYKYFYVDAEANPASGYGTGTESDPMTTLNFALVSVYARFTKIVLKNNAIHTFESDSFVTSPFLNDLNDPLNTINKIKFYEIHIIGEDSNNFAVVQWKGKMKITPKSLRFYIKNVTFNGNKLLQDCNQDHCFYCPYVDTYYEWYVDDRSYFIDNSVYENEYGKTCSDYKDEVLFNFVNEAYLENVIFLGFRHQFKTLIKASSKFSLMNVNFYYLQAKAGSYVIDYSCEDNCQSADMNFTNGVVSKLGYGYEDIASVATGSFFYGKGYHSVYIKDVDFTWNFAYTNLDSSDVGSLFYSEEFLGQIKIIDCNFEHNYVNQLIFIDVSSFIYPDLDNEYGVSKAYSQLHFEMKNVNFSNTYSSENLFTYLMKKTVHNIEISDVYIEKVAAGNGELFNIANSGNLIANDKVGGYKTIVTDGYPYYIYISPRHIQIVNLTISEVTSGDVIFNLFTLPNVTLENIQIFNVADGSKSTINDLI